MSTQRIFGLVILAAGITVLVIGLNATDSLGERVRDGFTGHYSDKTTWFIVGGICGIVVGVGLAWFGGRKILG
jgi:Mn2+/Fe2+ NRAMP family transporter